MIIEIYFTHTEFCKNEKKAFQFLKLSVIFIECTGDVPSDDNF